jgi:transcription initiation factor IIE alpha subunit
MSSQVALFLVRDLYGEHASRISEALIARPNSHLSQIKTFTKLDPDLLRQTLIIMLKANIVSYSVNSDLPTTHEITNDMDMHCFYHLNKPQLFHLSRLPNYLSEVQAKYSNYGKYSEISKIL